MTFLPNRVVGISEDAERLYGHWLGSIDERLDAPDCDRYEFCRAVLTEIHFPDLSGVDPATLSVPNQVLLAQMDARNVTLEPEYYAEIDLERYERVKPLIWLWEMFDRSALAENVHLGVKFRRLLAKRIFENVAVTSKRSTTSRSRSATIWKSETTWWSIDTCSWMTAEAYAWGMASRSRTSQTCTAIRTVLSRGGTSRPR